MFRIDETITNKYSQGMILEEDKFEELIYCSLLLSTMLMKIDIEHDLIIEIKKVPQLN